MSDPSDSSGWFQLALDGALGLGGAIFGFFVFAWRVQNSQRERDAQIAKDFVTTNIAIADLELRRERALAALEIRLNKVIETSRHMVGGTIQTQCVIPLEKVEQRCGALEQDVAVIKDRSGRA